MGVGVNIGNTLDNTTTWETGWGNPRITKEYVQSLARLGFKTVRVPVAWDTYARNGRIADDKLARVGEVVDWITAAGMFCVVNIHWDGGWIDSSAKERFPKTFATFSAEAEQQIHFVLDADRELLRRAERAADLRSAERGNEVRRRGLHAEGLRHADARQPALHRHGAQDGRQQREAPAHRDGLRHRHHQDHE